MAARAVESELQERQNALEELASKSAYLEELAKANERIVLAVTPLLERTLAFRERRTFWLNTSAGFVVGVLAGLLVDALRSWLASAGLT
jgi:pyrroline-5-carboxylate reductase